MTNIEAYKEAIRTIIEYISNKFGPEEESVINVILETKGITNFYNNQHNDISIRNHSSINSLESTNIGDDSNIEVISSKQHLNINYNNSNNSNNNHNNNHNNHLNSSNENSKINLISNNSESILNSDNEDISEKIRSILRMANTVEELNNAIKMAYAAGLSYEANLGERKLKKLLS